jgi:antitoxin ParD1/3/4
LALTPDQEAWVAAHVESGDFASVEDAVRQLIDAGIADHRLAEDDLAWAMPYVDEAIAEVERGEAISLEEHNARMSALLASLKA